VRVGGVLWWWVSFLFSVCKNRPHNHPLSYRGSLERGLGSGRRPAERWWGRGLEKRPETEKLRSSRYDGPETCSAEVLLEVEVNTQSD
jgi:hypothetical protein